MTMRRCLRRSGTALTAILALSAPSLAYADDVEKFYSNTNLTIIVPFNPGGGIDTYARLLARYIGKYVPGEPTVVVLNRPGAGGIAGVNHLSSVAPRDGSHIGTMTPPNAFAPLLGVANARFDANEFQWIGTMARDVPSCVFTPRSPAQSFSDLYKVKAVMGATGYSGMTAQHPFALRNVLGVQLDVTVGYPGTRDIWLAMERGEVDGVCGTWASLARGPLAQQFEEGKMRPFVQMGSRPQPVFGDAPLVYDLAESDEDRAVLRFVFGQTEATRPYFAPPGVPADRLRALRAAFMDAMRDPGLLRAAKEANLVIDPMDGEETESVFRSILATPKPIIERAKQVIARN